MQPTGLRELAEKRAESRAEKAFRRLSNIFKVSQRSGKISDDWMKANIAQILKNNLKGCSGQSHQLHWEKHGMSPLGT